MIEMHFAFNFQDITFLGLPKAFKKTYGTTEYKGKYLL